MSLKCTTAGSLAVKNSCVEEYVFTNLGGLQDDGFGDIAFIGGATTFTCQIVFHSLTPRLWNIAFFVGVGGLFINADGNNTVWSGTPPVMSIDGVPVNFVSDGSFLARWISSPNPLQFTTDGCTDVVVLFTWSATPVGGNWNGGGVMTIS